MIVNDAPRYIVMQNIATPIRHITVAIIVAYGIRVIHDLQQLPRERKMNGPKTDFKLIFNFLLLKMIFFLMNCTMNWNRTADKTR